MITANTHALATKRTVFVIRLMDRASVTPVSTVTIAIEIVRLERGGWTASRRAGV